VPSPYLVQPVAISSFPPPDVNEHRLSPLIKFITTTTAKLNSSHTKLHLLLAHPLRLLASPLSA
jgi:hypothetical protein